MTMARAKFGKPKMVPYTPVAAINAGDVVIVGATPFVAHVDNPPFGTTPILDALAAGGGIYECATDGTPVIGQEVFWNASTHKLTATAVGNYHFGFLVAGPTGDLGGASPASDGDIGYALHDPRSTPTNTLQGNRSEATASTTATLTVAQLLGGFVNSAPAAGITLTLPTAANMVAGIKGAKVGDSFVCAIENTSGGSNSITLAAGGATLRGGVTVAQNKSAVLFGVLTNVTASSEAYTVYSVVGA